MYWYHVEFAYQEKTVYGTLTKVKGIRSFELQAKNKDAAVVAARKQLTPAYRAKFKSAWVKLIDAYRR